MSWILELSEVSVRTEILKSVGIAFLSDLHSIAFLTLPLFFNICSDVSMNFIYSHQLYNVQTRHVIF